MTSHLTGRQTLATALKAELRRQLRLRRTQVVLVIAGALALLSALGAFAFARTVDDTLGSAGFAIPLGLELAAGTVSLVLSLSALSAVTGETGDGTVLVSLLLVPDRRRLLVARALVWPVLGAGLLLGLAPAVFLLGLAAQLPGTVSFPQFLLGVGIAGVAVALVMALSFLAATALRRGAPAMAVAIGFLLVLPLAVGVLQVVGPDALRPVFATFLDVLPGVAVLKALSVSAAVTQGWSQVIEGLLVLGCWVAATGLVAVARFRREGATAA